MAVSRLTTSHFLSPVDIDYSARHSTQTVKAQCASSPGDGSGIVVNVWCKARLALCAGYVHVNMQWAMPHSSMRLHSYTLIDLTHVTVLREHMYVHKHENGAS